LLVAAGFPLAYGLTRSTFVSFVIAPMVTGLTAALAEMITLLMGGRPLAWLSGLLLIPCALVPVMLRRDRPPVPFGGWVEPDGWCYPSPLRY
jgi:hypothetical protein